MTLQEFYTDFISRLKTIYDKREAVIITDWVFESIAGIKRLDRVANKKKELDDFIIQQLNKALERLIKYEPVQYVLEEAWFYKMKLKVNAHVLIPRPETEELVEWVIEECKMKNEKLKILDIGTGSGCIAIAIKNS